MRAVSNGVKPSDITEELWVRDLVDLSWENVPLAAGVNASLIARTVPDDLREILAPLAEAERYSDG